MIFNWISRSSIIAWQLIFYQALCIFHFRSHTKHTHCLSQAVSIEFLSGFWLDENWLMFSGSCWFEIHMNSKQRAKPQKKNKRDTDPGLENTLCKENATLLTCRRRKPLKASLTAHCSVGKAQHHFLKAAMNISLQDTITFQGEVIYTFKFSTSSICKNTISFFSLLSPNIWNLSRFHEKQSQTLNSASNFYSNCAYLQVVVCWRRILIWHCLAQQSSIYYIDSPKASRDRFSDQPPTLSMCTPTAKLTKPTSDLRLLILLLLLLILLVLLCLRGWSYNPDPQIVDRCSFGDHTRKLPSSDIIETLRSR